MIRRCTFGGLALLLLILAVLGGTGTASGQDAPSVDRGDRPDVLVLSLPTLAWADLYRGRTPNLDALLDGSAVAALSVRLIGRTTSAADGYASFSAGNRARGISTQSGQVLEPDEDFFGVPAGSVFRRNTGAEPGGGVVTLAQPAIARSNSHLDYDAEVGALGQALQDAGVPRAVIANADGRYALGTPTFDREGGSALADHAGVTPAGAVSRALVEEDPLAPFGVRYSQDAVLAAFDEVWPTGGVVMVEGSDLARVDRYRSLATPSQQARLRGDALARTDALIGGLLQRVDLEHDVVMVVGPYHSAAGAHLTVAALHQPGTAPGLLRTASTRRGGFVTMVDVAPTILDLVDADAPSSMEGSPFDRTERGAATGEQRAADLAEINRAAKFRDSQVVPVATAFVTLQAVLLVAAALVQGRFGRRGSQVIAFGAVAMLAFLPATYLAGRVSFQKGSDLAYYGFIAGVALAIAAAVTVLGRRHRLDGLMGALGVVFGVLVVDMVLGAPMQLNTVFGYSPTVGGRFAGMGNLAFGQFAGAAFLLAGLFVLRVSDRRHAVAAALGVLGLALVIDGSPIWGSDVGGVLALVPAIGFTASRMLRIPIRLRVVALWGTATIVVIGAFAAFDLSRPADSRTHLGRLVESVTDEGWGSFATVVSRKLGANLGVLTSTIWTAMVPVAIALAAYLLWRAPGAARALRHAIPDSLIGLAVVGFLGFALNDSGIAVPGIMIGVINASLVYLTVWGLPPDGPAEEADAPVPEVVPEPSALSSGLLAWGLLLLGGFAAAVLLERAATEVLAAPALQRRNYRGHELATAGGIIIVLAVLVVEAVRTALAEFGVGEELSDSLLRSMVLFACFAFAFLGLVDDLLGGEDRGFRGHLRALAEGRLTTGAMKLFGGGVVAIVLTAAPGEVSGRRLLADAALVALAANLGNLLDRAPGRTTKVALLAYVPLALAAGTSPVGLAVASVVGAAAGLLRADLAERLMLGDTGANLLGAVLGLAVVLETSRPVRTVVLVVLVVLNAASERVSFTKVIDATPGLRHLDRLGRRPLD